MLEHLSVNNFALVESLSLDFNPGMTVVTGETGAGKSIMLDALGLALGDRADTGGIGQFADKSEIVAVFQVADNPLASAWLGERELTTDDGTCILRRVIGKDGRSRAFINNAPSTATDLKSVGEFLVDIHSQHEHQSLLKRETHQRLLDDFGGTASLARQVAELDQAYQQSQKALSELKASSEEQNARLQLLSYQAEELASLNIQEGEYERLEAEQKKLANASTVLETCNQVLTATEGEDDAGIANQLTRAAQLLKKLGLSELHPIVDMLESAQIQVDEAIHDLGRFTGSFELDPARLAEAEQRLGAIYELCRKHRIEASQIANLTSNILQELDQISHLDDHLDALQAELRKLQVEYQEVAGNLSAKRKKAAKKLSKAVISRLEKLGMAGARFEVALHALDQNVPTHRGFESVEFLISTNPGQAPKALNKIASGGELSRISLAIQVVTANTSKVPSLIFDEVDVGIGGAVAEVVGSLLRQLGDKAQIICVTHLPQVAAQGHQHLQVEKARSGKLSTSIVTSLDENRKVEEIARMLGGVEMTEQSLAHAEEMYRTAQG